MKNENNDNRRDNGSTRREEQRMKAIFDSKEEFIEEFRRIYQESEGELFTRKASPADCYITLLRLLREKINVSWVDTSKKYARFNDKQVYYFSMEFLIGRLLKYYLVNLDLEDIVREGFRELGVVYETVLDQEEDPGIGNGGLGRLAACFLDSMAHLGMAGHGNGLRYRYGLFRQKIADGYQLELPDGWLRNGYPWEKEKRNKAVEVRFGGQVAYSEEEGVPRFHLEGYHSVLAVPYDIPVIGVKDFLNINTLRLWSAEPMEDRLDMHSFNSGDFSKALQYRSDAEAISSILYPDDSGPSGRELRLKQEYFLVSAGIQSILRHQKKSGMRIQNLNKKVAIHINDTHPALSIPEMMRILVDEEGISWEQAWAITTNTISYTNHTILPEALEKWPVGLVQSLLPRVYQIIEEIDRRFRREVHASQPDAERLLESTAILRDGYVHMANLAVVGSYSINGVAELHTDILKNNLFRDFYTIYPERFNNKTNGVSHRRFLFSANPSLSALISSRIGDAWREKAGELARLKQFENDQEFLEALRASKLENKQLLAAYIKKKYGLEVDPSSIFDIQVKRIHAYKRQLMNALKIMDLYNRLTENPDMAFPKVTFLFAGKAAPGYYYAKAVIKLINLVAEKINNDPVVSQRIKVLFLEDFNVTLGEMIYPAADISEQISTASQEASGTGNMKFMFNGGITLGTLDGANVEILREAGPENVWIFGLTAEQVLENQREGRWMTEEECEKNPRLRKIIDQLRSGFLGADNGEVHMIVDSLLPNNDYFFVLRDFQAYVDAFDQLCHSYEDREGWARMSLSNIAAAGYFTSDRSIRDYANDIWMVRHN